MPWQYIFLSRQLSDDALKDGFSQFLNVEPETIVIQHEHPDFDNVGEHVNAVCTLYTWGGDFPCAVEPIIIKRSLFPKDNDLISVGILCELMHCHALIDFGTSNPYLFSLIKDRHRYQKVGVDPDKLDAEIDPQVVITSYGNIVEN